MAAVTIAVLGFLSIYEYKPRAGFIWNLLHAQIHLTPACEAPTSEAPWTLFQPEKPSLLKGDCGVKLPYKWVLATAFLLAVIGVIWPQHNSGTAPAAITSDDRRRPRIFPVTGWLVLISAGCVAFLGLVTPALEYAPGSFPAAQGYEHSWGRYAGQALGSGMVIFLAASIAAAISAWVGRSNPITVGGVAAAALTLLGWLGS